MPSIFWARRFQRVALLAIGAVLLTICVEVTSRRRDFMRHALEAPGVVAGLNSGGSHPQIAFVTGEGKQVSYPQGGLIFGFRSGDRVRVFYRAEDPAGTACVDRLGALWFASGLSGVLGSLFVLAAVPSLFRSLRATD